MGWEWDGGGGGGGEVGARARARAIVVRPFLLYSSKATSKDYGYVGQRKLDLYDL